ncbi:hypothetical protein K438DRAFT_1972194 [Mycena galopus ATCC 62051]|nr:hypothetical protein K438DRAFT_1972194 [Mycena galopus ATCC 62051]
MFTAPVFLGILRDDDPSIPPPCIIPQVINFFFSGPVLPLRTIILPKLKHLVLENLASVGAEEVDVELMHLLEQSGCALISLEIHHHISTTFPSLLLLYDNIAPGLNRLLISSRNLNNFFTALEGAEPDTLPEDIRLL